MGVYQRGAIWWYEFHFLGSRVRESSNSSNKDVALRIERERRRELELGAGNIGEIRRPLMFSKVAKEWAEGNPHWSDSTREIANTKLAHLLPEFGKMLVNDIKPHHVAAYQRKRQRDEASRGQSTWKYQRFARSSESKGAGLTLTAG